MKPDAREAIRSFLWALDRGFFGSDMRSVDLSNTAFLEALREAAARPVDDSRTEEVF